MIEKIKEDISKRELIHCHLRDFISLRSPNSWYVNIL